LQLSLLSCFEIFIYYPPIRFGGFPLKQSSLIPVERIEKAIYFIRGERVILDADLARLYGVETRALVQAVKRNLQRFPKDFMFQLSLDEFKFLRSQIVISKSRGGRRYMPPMSSLSMVPAPPDRKQIGFRSRSQNPER